MGDAKKADPKKKDAKKTDSKKKDAKKPALPDADSWNGYVKDGDANPVKVIVTPDAKACIGSAYIKKFVMSAATAKDHMFILNFVDPMTIALNTAISQVGNKKMKKEWKGFVGTKKIFKITVNDKPADKKDAKKKDAKKDPKKKDSKKTDAKKKDAKKADPKKKDTKKADSKKKRRLQAATSTPTISSTGGVDANSYTPGVTIPNNVAGDGQAAPSTANVIKALSLALLALLFFN